LKTLILNDNLLSDFDGRAYGNLEYLNVDKNCISKISNIYRLSNLKSLFLRNQKKGDMYVAFYNFVKIKKNII